MPHPSPNTTASKKLVLEIKRTINLVKEQAHGIENTLPFSGLSKLITIELLHFIVSWLNNLLVKSGVSTIYSLRELICCYCLLKDTLQKNNHDIM
jgi:hypothetical protein